MFSALGRARAAPRNAGRASGLTVDVFVTTLNEPVDIDAGRSSPRTRSTTRTKPGCSTTASARRCGSLRQETGCRYAGRTEHADAKAGNLNHALAQAHGEFIAIFDADHVAIHAFSIERSGISPMRAWRSCRRRKKFFNVDSFEHLIRKRATSNGASFFHRVVQRSRDARTRRSSPDRPRCCAGAHSTTSAASPRPRSARTVQTSFRLHAAGWRSLFHPEVLSAGLAPLDSAAYCGQRLRWPKIRCNCCCAKTSSAIPA